VAGEVASTGKLRGNDRHSSLRRRWRCTSGGRPAPAPTFLLEPADVDYGDSRWLRLPGTAPVRRTSTTGGSQVRVTMAARGQAGGRQRHGWAAAVVTVRAGGQPRRRQFFGADARTVVLCQVLAPGRTLGFSIGFT
jgi:hypothetical protein